MDFVNLIKEAEIDMLLMSGRGLGAVLLTVIALAVVWRAKTGSSFVRDVTDFLRCGLFRK